MCPDTPLFHESLLHSSALTMTHPRVHKYEHRLCNNSTSIQRNPIEIKGSQHISISTLSIGLLVCSAMRPSFTTHVPPREGYSLSIQLVKAVCMVNVSLPSLPISLISSSLTFVQII